jgi:hypothetical protein
MLRITLSQGSPAVNEDVTLRVGTDSGTTTPARAAWDFGDGQQGSGVAVTHHWAVARTYQVSVHATMPDGRQASTSATVVVSAAAKVTLTVATPANGSVTGGGIDCPGTCSVTVDAGTGITLTAHPDTQHYFTFAGWGGACGGTGDCAVAMTGDTTVSAAFRDMAAAPDCQAYNPGGLAVTPNADGSFQLTDGSRTLDKLDNAADAGNALAVARQFTEQCFVGRDVPSRPDLVMQYWQGGPGHAGPNSTCTTFDPGTVAVVPAGGLFEVADGGEVLKTFVNEPDAVRALRLYQAAQRQLAGQPEHTVFEECFLGTNSQRTPHYQYVFEFFPGSNST